VGTSFQGAPITFTVGDKQYVAILGGGIGVGGGLAPELSNMQAANMLWVFALE
jgi:alcohol dehydrogenase (cytochrome c)